MNNKIQRALLKVRDSNVLQRYFLGILAKHNLSPGEIYSYDFDEEYPRIYIRNGPTLCAFDDLRIGAISGSDLPETHTGCLAAYILRYLFPHSLPHLAINTGIIPRKLFPAVIHRQHINTLHDLDIQHKEEFLDVMPVREGDYVLEIGSYIGCGTVHLSRIVGKSGRIHSIEADSDAYEILQKNIKNNSIQNVRTGNFAVGGEDQDSATFYKSGRQANSLHQEIVESSKARSVQVKSLATLLNEIDFIPNFLILTINGSEFEALNSARDFLAKTNNLRIVVPGWYADNQGKLGRRIIELLHNANFKVACTTGMHIFAYKNA